MTADGNPIAHLHILDTPPEPAFDDIAALAAQVCQAPTALVSLLDTDRQWFKARVNFACDQTDLDRSVCRFVVAAAKTLVIPDLTADPRTAENPLVTGEPHIRFYAGAPLNTRYGPVGALCVIDTQARPDGLTPGQCDGLERLARQVVVLLEARRDAIDLRDSIAAHGLTAANQQLSERRWRDLYHGMDQGFIYGRVVRDAAGKIVDWRYEDVNRAWGKLVGLDPELARGRTVRELIPGIEDEWVDEIARVVDTHEPARFTRQVGSLHRWYDGTAQWVGGDDFTVMFHEVTDRVEAERKRDALLVLGDAVRDTRGVDDLLAQAARIVGEVVNADRATFGAMDHGSERVVVVPGWARDGMPPIAGSYRFADYGRIKEYLLQGRVVVINDVETDTRTNDEAGRWRQLQARAVVNVPVREHGRTVSALLVHRREPHRWTTDEIAFLRNAADRVELAAARLQAEERQQLLNGELSHRLKNTLTVVQAIASQTLGSADPNAVAAFGQRLIALSTAHEVLLQENWSASTVQVVASRVLATFDKGAQITIEGPELNLGPRATLALSLLLHELATNAIKYGALGTPTGRVRLSWSLTGDTDEDTVLMEWAERGGPPAVAPTRKGFGSRVIRLGLSGSGGVGLRYEEQGFTADMTATIGQLRQA